VNHESVSAKSTAVYLSKSRLVLGVDGGGTKTEARLASLDQNGQLSILGRGRGGPSNLMLAGKEQSLRSLDDAVNEVVAGAAIGDRIPDYAVLALAGSTSPDVQRDITAWAVKRNLARHFEIAHDADPVLACGTDEGWGISLIVGTGSVAVGKDLDGQSVTKGGWGHWFGDKGSGFYLGYKALAAVAEASDEIGPTTILSDLVLDNLGTANPRNILKEVTAGGDTRREVAALAPLVLDAALKDDSVARRIVSSAVNEAVKLVSAVSRALDFETPYPLAVAGGVVCKSDLFRQQLLAGLARLEPAPEPVTVVEKPVLGCLEIARSKLLVSG
jgi:N-acetylglucosamine kinase-like BadF-type ATPase